PEALAVPVHGGHEDILHLQIAARVQERQRIDEALGRAARQVKTHVLRRLAEEVLEMALVESRRQRYLREIVEGDQSLLEAHGIPRRAPERNSTAALTHDLGPDLEESADEAREILHGQIETLRELPRALRCKIGARLHEIDPPVPPDQLVVGQ